MPYTCSKSDKNFTGSMGIHGWLSWSMLVEHSTIYPCLRGRVWNVLVAYVIRSHSGR